MGITKRDLFAAFAACALLVSCAATFPYRFYFYDFAGHRLMGAAEDGSQDLSDQVCISVTGGKYPCTVMLTDDYLTMKGDYLKTKNDLIECQKGNPPS